MNIGIDIRPLLSDTRTGVGEYTYEFLDAIFNIDKQNQYFLFYNPNTKNAPNTPSWAGTNINFITTKYPNKLFNCSQKLFSYPKIDKLMPQIDFFFSPNLNFTSLSMNTKFVLTIHDLSFNFFPDFFSSKQRLWHKIVNPKKQCQRANIILTPSENTKQDIINCYGVDCNKIKVIYPGLSSMFYKIDNEQLTIDKAKIKEKYSLTNNFILFLGTIEPRKNIIGLIEAYEQSYTTLFDPLYLVIAGADGWHTKAIYERAKKSPLKEHIKFIGYVDAKDKPALYSMASLFIYPSFYEGFGFPVLEAMAMGTPVITSNRSSLPEVAQSSAYLINPNKPTEIATAITQLMTKKKLKQYFKNKGIEQSKKFNWENAAKEFLKVISDIL
jgi:glycosyltransferase involved in cell wall biosynthesis